MTQELLEKVFDFSWILKIVYVKDFSEVEIDFDGKISQDWTKVTVSSGEKNCMQAGIPKKERFFRIPKTLSSGDNIPTKSRKRVIVKTKRVEFYRSASLHKMNESGLYQTKYSIIIFYFNGKQSMQWTCEKKAFFVYKPFLWNMEERWHTHQ